MYIALPSVMQVEKVFTLPDQTSIDFVTDTAEMRNDSCVEDRLEISTLEVCINCKP